MYETRKHPLISRRAFLTRMARNFFIGLLATVVSLGLGMSGYHYIEGMSWVESYENAAMILSGMGPVTDLKTTEGKLFAGSYALFSGIVFLLITAIIFAPLIHRAFHKFHVEEEK